MIERRRAPEFAAMAAAGEDDDDDDDETDRRASTKPGKQGGPPGPGKSLKGKESFKSRQPTRSDYDRAKKRKRATSDRRGFIEGLTSQPSTDEEDNKPDMSRTRHPSVRTIHTSMTDKQDMSSMQYAMNLHQTPNYPPQSSARLQYSNPPYRDQPLQPSYANFSQTQYPPQPSSTPYQNYPSQPPANNLMPNNMQWDPEMVSRYAEYQLQQNHQRQQRILLERQRHQLAELGIPTDDSQLLDQIFAGGQGAGMVPTPQQGSSSHSHPHSSGTPQDDMDTAGFVWPTARNPTQPTRQQSGMSPVPAGMLDHLYGLSRDGNVKEGDDTGFTWPTAGGGGDPYMPSPDSAEELKKAGTFVGGNDDRARIY